MKKFAFNPTVAKQLMFDLNMLTESNDPQKFVVKNSFIRIDDGSKDKGYRKPVKGEKIDLNKEMNHVYVVLGIEGQAIDFGSDLAQLNNCEGWLDVINVNGNEFSLKDGAHVQVVGTSLVFSLN